MRKEHTKRAPRIPGPWEPPLWDIADAAAIQALYRGDATQDQQQRAINWIVESASDAFGMSYRPGGMEGARDTDFAEGRRFVGNQIRKLNILNLAAFKEDHG